MGNQYLIISVIGSHAGETLGDIFLRKQKDIKERGKTYWLIQSHKTKTKQVQEICKGAAKDNLPVYCLFIEPSQKNGAKPTLHDKVVTQISADNQNWEEVSIGIKITGKISPSSTALVFDELKIFKEPALFDLWKYSEFQTKQPIKMMLGASTVCCERIPSKGMKNRFRKVIGAGRLVEPYGLWLK